MSNQLPNPIEIIELGVEGLYEETFLNTSDVGAYDEFQMKAEINAVKQAMENKGRRHRSSNWY